MESLVEGLIERRKGIERLASLFEETDAVVEMCSLQVTVGLPLRLAVAPCNLEILLDVIFGRIDVELIVKFRDELVMIEAGLVTTGTRCLSLIVDELLFLYLMVAFAAVEGGDKPVETFADGRRCTAFRTAGHQRQQNE